MNALAGNPEIESQISQHHRQGKSDGARQRWRSASAPGERPGLLRPGRVLLALLVLFFGVYLPARAQSYSIDWYTIDGGGGTSTGGVYSVNGTIGQPDASSTTMTGGTFSLTGGFWSLVAIQTDGAPKLTMVPAGSGHATISWSPDAPGFVLQETLSLSPTNWVNSVSGATNPVIVPVPGDTRFYRVFKP